MTEDRRLIGKCASCALWTPNPTLPGHLRTGECGLRLPPFGRVSHDRTTQASESCSFHQPKDGGEGGGG